MSKIKQLRNDESNSINMIELFELFAPEKKSKYVETMLRMLKNTPRLKEHRKEIIENFCTQFPFISKEQLEAYGDMQIIFYYRFIESYFSIEDLKQFRKFCEYNERNLIDQNDLTKYKTFDDITTQLSLAEMKAESKILESQIVKVFESEEWLLLRPLTYEASKKYGANTKWCTTSENNTEYFTKYTSKGVLIYCINKKSGYKVASFYSLDKNDPEFSFWNQKDSRIDSLQTELTDDLRKIISEVSMNKSAKTNRYLLSDDARSAEDKKLGTLGGHTDITEETLPRRTRRIANAIGRLQEEYGDVPVMEQPSEPQPNYEQERMEEAMYENRENMSEVEMPRSQSLYIAPESSIDRMQWSSTSTTTTSEE